MCILRCLLARHLFSQYRYLQGTFALLPSFLVLSISFLLAFSILPLHSSTAHAAANEPYGLNALTSLDRLPYLKSDTLAAGQSSFDRTGGNKDYSNFLYTDTHGDNVLLDLKNPGTVYRMWFTGFSATTLIKVYFDGSSTPQINMKLSQLFDGSMPPFLPPLVANDSASSGGFVSYVPLPFHSAIKITTSGGTDYYNIGYHVYSPDTQITTWTGAEDTSTAQTEWSNANLGINPISTNGNTIISGTTSLAAGAAQTLLDTGGPQEISSIKLHIPDVVVPPSSASATDDGRAHKGTSQFTMAINPANQGVYLTRRLDYGIANQKATVSVNGQFVGTWFNSGSDGVNHWHNSSFFIPSSFTVNKSSITITITFVSSSIDWNEFTYWITSILSSGKIQTDTLDVGNAASESAHGYSITNQTWTGSKTFTYPTTDSATTDVLNNTWLQISWDNESTPSVNAPIGSLFGLGQFGSYGTRALMMGLDENNWLYLYFPMPFANHAHIALINKRSSATNAISYEIQYKPFTDSFQNVGYFKTQFNTQQPTTNDNDILILDAQGAGQFLGEVQSMDGPANRQYLEGDERIYTDGSNSPSFQGTGTEDFFNGGWYFKYGPYTAPISGNTVHIATSTDDKTAAYRLFLQDSVPFHTHLHVSIEHGPYDTAGVNENVWTLAYYYLQPARATLTDTLDVGNNSSELAHHYSITTQTWQGTRSFTFEGTNNTVKVTDDGRAHKGTSQFTMAINPNNNGVILRRQFDQEIFSQQSQILVDGAPVGIWYKAGGNSTFPWREEDFLLPASFTSGKSSITITVQFVSSAEDWNEFHYWVYSEQ